MKSKRRYIPRPNVRVRCEANGKGGFLMWFEVGPEATAVTFSLTMEQWVELLHLASESVAKRKKK